MGNAHSVEIDLSDRQLTSVTLEQLGSLVSAPCAYRILSQLKQDRSQHVLRLYLRRNQLSYLPANFEALLSNLTDLSLRGNELVQFPVEITSLKHLSKLSVASNAISYIPPEISKLRHLEWLNIAGNTIDDLPAELAKCKRLSHLDIQKNRFKRLPSCISYLQALQVLLAQKNSISQLGVDGFPASLQTLNLSFNCLETIPQALFNLPSIEALIISSNAIPNFPAELCLTNPTLTNLDLHTNKLHTVPSEISHLKHLRRLNIAINQIEEIPDSIGELKCLEWLNINDNKLTELPESIGELRNLIKFGIVQNQLEHLPDSIGRLSLLCKLDMRRNQFKWLPGSILKLRDHLESTQTFIETREDNLVRTLRPGIGSLKTILMGENEKLQYYEGIVCDASSGETLVFPANLENVSDKRLNQLHLVQSLSEIATRCLLDSIIMSSASTVSLRHHSARQSLLRNIPTNMLPLYTRETIVANTKQCEGCLRLYCHSHIYVAELGCMGDSRIDVPVRFRMCSYGCAKTFIETDKSVPPISDEPSISDGLEALDHPSHDSSSVLQEGSQLNRLQEPSITSTSSGRHFSFAKFLQNTLRSLFSLHHGDDDMEASEPSISQFVTLSNVSSRSPLLNSGRYVTVDVSELEKF